MTENQAEHGAAILAAVEQLERSAQLLADSTSGAPIDIDLAARLLGSAARIHCAAVAGGDPGGRGNQLAISPTEAVTAANAMLESQALSVFEFSLWAQASKTHATTNSDPQEGENS